MEISDQYSQVKQNLMDRENLKSFYKKRLPDLLKTVLLHPVRGTQLLFTESREGVYGNAVLLMVTTMLLYFLTPYLLAGKYVREILSFGMLFKFALLAGIFMLVVSALSFGIKSVSGRPVFKNELLTGALCGLGLILLLIVVFMVRIFGPSIEIYDLMNPAGMLQNIGFMLVFLLYVFLFMVNIFQQSLKAGGAGDALSWYVSPLAILLAFYITAKVARSFLVPSSPF